MKKEIVFIRKKPGFWAGFFILLLYISLHFLTLHRYPFVHSDEAWLAGLSRSMAETRSLAATEDFFKLTPRYPHAIKTAFHLLQMPFLKISYSPFMARLPGLFAGFGVLYLMLKLAETFGLGRRTKYLPAVLLGLDSQFWYCSHFARQEILLVLLMLVAIFLSLRKNKRLLSAIPLILAFFVHPNGAIVAIPVVFVHLSNKKQNKGHSFTLLYFIMILAAGAAAVIGASLLMDSDFLAHYMSFGESVGVTDSILVKLLKLPRFYSKMLHRIAGTYYLPPINFGFLLFLAAFPISVAIGWRRRTREHNAGALLFFLFLSINIGYVILGKYSPPGIIFLYPFGYLAFGVMIHDLLLYFCKRPLWKYLLIVVIAGAATCSGTITFKEIYRQIRLDNYTDMSRRIRAVIPEDEIVLANLNTGFVFNGNSLLPWRDLEFLGQRQLAEWLKLQNVEWVITSDELGWIYKEKPVWRNLYGDLAWYPALNTLLQERGELMAEWESPIYGMRIIPYQNNFPTTMKIYHLRW